MAKKAMKKAAKSKKAAKAKKAKKKPSPKDEENPIVDGELGKIDD